MTKITRYFENYQDAYNYYGGTNVPSKEIALVGDASYVFVSSDNAGDGGNTQYFDAAMTNDEIVATQVDAAYVSGTTQGYEQGYSEGYPLGYTAGHTAGYTEGETAGYDAGHSAGYAEGEAAGYEAGTSYGYTWGEEVGYTTGHTAGYAEGEADYIAGMIENGTMSITTTSQVDVMDYAYAQVSDANLIPSNIVSGTTILGVAGSYTGLVPTGTAYLQMNTLTDVTAYEFAYCEDTNGSYTAGYEGGTSYGYDWGYPIGYAEGQTYGESIGYTAGHTAGYNEGEEIGYASGYTAGTTYGYDWGYPIGYTAGTTYGESIGYTTGYSAGYSYGYGIGYAEGEDSATTPYNEQYFTFEAFNDGRDSELTIDNNGVSISYSSDGGTTWTSIAPGDSETFTLEEGGKLMLKGINNTLWVDDGNYEGCGLTFTCNYGSFTAYGNIMSLLAGDNFTNATLNTSYTDQFHSLFIDFTGLTHAKDIVLPANGESVDYAFSEMFSGCTNLEDVPVICTAPSRAALGQGTYAYMFDGCENLGYVVLVTSQPLATESTQGEGYDILEIGSFGSQLEEPYLVVQSSQADNVIEAKNEIGSNITVLGYDSTNDTACYSTNAETFCLRMAAKYLPQENYDEGYDAGYDDGYADGEDAGGSLDPTSQVVTDSSKWQVLNYGADSQYPATTMPYLYEQAIEAMDVEWYAEEIDSIGDENAVVAIDMFNPRGTVEILTGTQDVTIAYQRNDPEDPNTNAYISIDIDLEAGESAGLSFAWFTDDAESGSYLFDGMYWGIDDNVSNNHWIITAEETGTYNIMLEADGNGGCTMTITEPEPEP